MATPALPIRRAHRRWLAATTALAGFVALPAYGQTLPGSGDVDSVVANGGSPAIVRAGTTLNVSLNADNTIINWNGFNIPENTTANFDRGLLGPLGKIAVLNRDISGNPSQLLGRLSSGANVAVWVMNASGIMVGSKANISTGSLVLSTLDMTDADFLDRNGSFALTTPAISQSAITVMNGARIKVAGGNRGLILVAPNIDAHGTFDATDQDVAFVTASDVNLTFTAGSPLSVQINRGTAVSGRSQFVRGTVTGADALFALASQDTVTDALLRVDASVTTAVAGTRGIVLSAGRPAVAVDGVTFAGTTTDTGGIAGLMVGGDLTSNDTDGGSDILAGATGMASFTGALSSERDITLAGGDDTTVAGAVTAGRNYAVSGRTVTLGGSAPVLQKADGAVAITASRALTGRSGLTLQANADGSTQNPESLTLAATFDGIETAPDGTTSIVPSGTIDFAPGTILRGGTNRQSSVRILSGAADGSVALGQVFASALTGGVGNAAMTIGIVRQAAVSTGDLSVVGRITLEGTTVRTGALNSGDAVQLTSTTGGLATGTIDAMRSVTLVSAGALGTGRIDSGGTVSANAIGDALFGSTIDATDDLVLRAGSIRLSGGTVTSGGTIDLQARSGGISTIGGLRLTSTSSNTADFVRLQAAGAAGIDLTSSSRLVAGTNRALRVIVDSRADGAALVLGDVTARALTGPAGVPIVTSGSQNFGILDLVDGFAASSTTGNLRVASIAVTGTGQGISLSAPVGTLFVPSTLRASGDVSLVGGSSITLDTVESLQGAVSVVSGGAIDLNTLAGVRGASATGASVTIDAVRGGTGRVAIGATAGGIALGRVDGGRLTFDAAGGDIAVTDTVTGSGAISATGSGAIRFARAVTATGGGVTIAAGTGAATVLGGVSAAGDYSVRGASVALAGRHEARGGVAIEATAGRIVGQSGLVIAADSDDIGAEPLTLNATGGGIALGESTLSAGRNGRSAVTVTTDSGNIALGDITARSLTIAGSTGRNSSILTGNLSLVDSLSATAGNGVTTGTIGVSAGGVTIDGGAGAVGTGAITATDAVSLTGARITHGAISGRGVGVTATDGSILGGNITSNGAIDVTAARGGVTLGRLVATGTAGNVTLAAAGTLLATGVTANGAATLSAGNANADILLQEGLAANGAVLVTAGRDIRAPFIRSLLDTLTVSAPNGSVGGFGGGKTALSAGPGKAFSLTVGNAVELDDIAGGPIQISAASILAGAIDAGGNAISLVARSGDLTVLGNIAAGDTTLTAAGRTSLRSVTAGGALTLSGGAGLSFADVAGTSVSITSNGAIAGDSAQATAALSVTGGSVALDDVGAGGALALTATNGDVALDSIVGGQNVSISATGRAAITGNVTAGGGYSVTGASVALGNGPTTQRAAGPIVITARGGDIVGATGLTLGNSIGTIILDSAGAIALSGSTLSTRGALGLRAGTGRSIALGGIESASVGGYDGTTIGTALRHSGSFTASDITTGSIDIGLSAGDLATGRITAPGAVALAAASGSITTGAITGASVNLNAGGVLSAVSVTTGGAATLAGSDIRTDAVRAASIGVRTAGTLRGIGAGRTALTSTAGDITATAGDMSLATVESAGAVSLDGGAIDIAGKLTAARQALVKARAALTMGDATAGSDLTLGADGALTAGALVGGGAVAVTGRGIRVGDTRAGTTLALTSGADLTLASGQSGGGATIDATGLATLGALTAGPSILIRAADAALTGVQRAATVTFENRAAASTTMRIGDTNATGGFRLSNAEVALIDADTVRFNQGTGALQLGTLTFGADTGRRTVEMLTTGAIDVDGTVTGGGLGRMFRIGGGASDGSASRIYVTATSTGGGRLLFDNANLDLRGDRIAIGLAPGFVNALTPDAAGNAQALSFLNNGNSALYNAGLGGGFYDVAATTLVSAYSLSVRFADFALVQNTGVPGQFSGVALGGTLAAPAMSVLTVRSTGNPASGGFAMFGTINGVGGPAASLLGAGVIDIDPGLLGTSRINGCLAGSGVGCLSTIVIQPVLQTFEWDSEDVFGVAQDVSTPFDPVVGGNNEELLTGLPALAPEPAAAEPDTTESPSQ